MIETVNRMYGNTWDGKKIMVYGLTKCDYLLVGSAFVEIGQTIAYSFYVGDDNTAMQRSKFQGIVQIKSGRDLINFQDSTRRIARVCKAAITNIVFLNYVRLERNESIVPILFCIEMHGKKNILTLKMMTGRTPRGERKIITASEIRRAYKHCTDPELSEKIKFVAQMTFRFVRVRRLSHADEPYQLTEIPAPWAHPSFELGFAARTAARQNFGESNWRDQLNELVAEYDLTKVY